VISGFRFLDHPADLGVEAWGETTAAAFEEAARALFSAMVRVDRVRPVECVAISVTADGLESALVEWLAALLAEKDISRRVFSRFQVALGAAQGGIRVDGRAWGEALDPRRHDPALEVKGISYLGLRVTRREADWLVCYVADV
jgi:SHS2 domain-containing protein